MKKFLQLKRLKKNKGFTLVECVVALALLAIMSTMLMTILSMASQVHAANRSAEQAMDEQVVGMAQGSITETTDVEPVIQFYNGTNAVASIDGSTTGVDVHFNRDSSSTYPLGGMNFDCQSYQDFVTEEAGGAGGSESNARVYGACDTSSVQIVQAESTLDSTTGTYTIKWQCSFSVSTNSDILAMKIVMPIGAEYQSSSGTACNTLLISDRIVRIQPTVVGGCSAVITFTLSESSYNSFYRSFANYMRNKSSSDPVDLYSTSVIFNRVTDENGTVSFEISG